MKVNRTSDINTLNAQYYNVSGSSFDRIACKPLLTQVFKKHEIQGDVLEIGSGTGALALWLEKMGCKVACIEPAEGFARKIRDKGLLVHPITFQQFEMNETYDHIVAISSLIHIPKEELPKQIEKIALGLKVGGKLFLTLIEGEEEEFSDPTQMGRDRFFSRLSEEEIKSLFFPYFTRIESHKIYQKQMDRFFFLEVYVK